MHTARYATFTFVSLFLLTTAHEACLDLSGYTSASNSFCSEYSGKTCCSSGQDNELQQLFQGLTIQSATCSNFIKQGLCSRCDPWGAHLFGVEDLAAKSFPSLCSSYCSSFYDACANENINWPSGQNPFQTSSPVLSTTYPTKESFCNAYAPMNSEVACYSGSAFVPLPAPPVPAGSPQICVEFFTWADPGLDKILKIEDPHDNSGRLFAAYQNGKVEVVDQNTGSYISTLIALPVLDNGEAGLIGLAAHPKFASNGKVYVFWSSQNGVPAECQDDDWCNGGTCNNGVCNNYMTNVLDEYYVPQGSSVAQTPAVRRLLTVSKPFNNHNGGDLTFGPDGYLYFGTGDGGDANDPFNNAQNLNRRCGKIHRIDVDGAPIAGRNYAVPASNPFIGVSKFPEIYAYGFRNPWRMSFDPFRPSNLVVADVGQDYVEEVDIVVKGGNFGWPKFEGNGISPTKAGASGITTGQTVPPVLEYSHSQTGSQGPSIIGGYFYTGSRDSCLYGKYIFGDWTNIVWSADYVPGSAQFSFNVNYRYGVQCTGNNCNGINSLASFSVDDKRDLYLLGTTGAYRVVEPSRCGLTCNSPPISFQPPPTNANPTPATSSNPSDPSAGSASSTSGSGSPTSGSSGSDSASSGSSTSGSDSASSSTFGSSTSGGGSGSSTSGSTFGPQTGSSSSTTGVPATSSQGGNDNGGSNPIVTVNRLGNTSPFLSASAIVILTASLFALLV